MRRKYILTTHHQEDFYYPQHSTSFNWSTNDVENHHHSFYEFFLITKGEYIHYLNDQVTHIKRGSFMLITPKDTHMFIAKNGSMSQHINFCATPQKFKALCDALSDTLFDELTQQEQTIISLQPYQIDFFLNVASQINLNNFQKKTIQNNLMLINEMLLFAISTVYKTLHLQKEDYPIWFQEILSKIHSPEFVSLHAKDVYTLSNYSPSTFIKIFKKYTGETIVSYLTKIKMNYACNLLATTDATTLSIATSLAYDSLSSFNHLFKAHTGVSPTEYRKSHKQSKTQKELS